MSFASNPSRRELLTLGGFAVLGTLPLSKRLHAAYKPPAPPFQSTSPMDRVSLAVVNSVTANFAQSYNNLASGIGTVSDVQSAQSSAQILIAHFDEVGLTDYANQQVNNSAGTLAAGVAPSPTLVNQIVTALAAQGTNISTAQVQTLLTVSSDRAQSALTYQAANGVSGANTTSVNNLGTAVQNWPSNDPPPDPNGPPPVLNAQVGPKGAFLEGDPQCGAFQDVIDTILIVAGMFGLGALAGCVPCAVIAAVLALFAAVLQFVKDQFC